MYTLEQLSIITGLTTRTLRSYLSQGLLHGSKQNGKWTFTDEQVEHFLNQSVVSQLLHTKKLAHVYDFLGQRHKSISELCVVLDLPATPAAAEEAAAFFCSAVNNCPEGSRVHFSFEWDAGCARLILTGPESIVQPILAGWYARC